VLPRDTIPLEKILRSKSPARVQRGKAAPPPHAPYSRTSFKTPKPDTLYECAKLHDMAQSTVIQAPGLSTFLKSLKTTPVDPSVEHLISYSRQHIQCAHNRLTSPGYSSDDKSETRGHARLRQRRFSCVWWASSREGMLQSSWSAFARLVGA
jgi:hypothetical protein